MAPTSNGTGKVTIVTHSSHFHTDDVFAVATLLLALEKDFDVEVIRSRDQAIIDKADYVVDVGLVYDESKNRFDHHQEEGAGKRENGVPYASFGIVWKKFGEQLTKNKKVANKIDVTIIQPIDSGDNGLKFLDTRIAGLCPFDIGLLVNIFSPTWKESTDNIDDYFIRAVSYAKFILTRFIKVSIDNDIAEEMVVEAYQNSLDKRLVEVDSSWPWEETLSKFPEPLFVIYKNGDNNWSVKGIRTDPFSYQPKKRLLESWAGKTGEDLSKITGISGCVFCHRQRFMAVNKTKEGILKMAEIALNS